MLPADARPRTRSASAGKQLRHRRHVALTQPLGGKLHLARRAGQRYRQILPVPLRVLARVSPDASLRSNTYCTGVSTPAELQGHTHAGHTTCTMTIGETPSRLQRLASLPVMARVGRWHPPTRQRAHDRIGLQLLTAGTHAQALYRFGPHAEPYLDPGISQHTSRRITECLGSKAAYESRCHPHTLWLQHPRLQHDIKAPSARGALLRPGEVQLLATRSNPHRVATLVS